MPQAFTPQLGNSQRSHRTEVMFSVLVGIVVVVFCVLSLVYLSHANAVATKGYKIKQLQEERSYLQAELDIWNLKLTRLQSLHILNGSEQVAQMESFTESPKFVTADTQVAMMR